MITPYYHPSQTITIRVLITYKRRSLSVVICSTIKLSGKMKVLIAIALLSVTSALPRPGVSDIDFRPLIVPKEIIEAAQSTNDVQKQDSGIAVNFVDKAENNVEAVENAGVKVNFVDNAEESVPAVEEAGVKVNFVDSPTNEMADNAGTAVNFVDSPVEAVESESDDGISVHFVDNADGSVAVNFVDSPVETSDDDVVAVNFVDSAPDAAVEVADGTAVHFIDSPMNEIPQDSLLAINFVNLPLETNAGAILIIGNVYEPISASELETVRVVDMPVPVEEIRSPGKVYDNPLLR